MTIVLEYERAPRAHWRCETPEDERRLWGWLVRSGSLVEIGFYLHALHDWLEDVEAA
jgi:hypothetical protein